jgi:hypothetical protein
VAGIIAALIVALIQRKEAVSQRELAEKSPRRIRRTDRVYGV